MVCLDTRNPLRRHAELAHSSTGRDEPLARKTSLLLHNYPQANAHLQDTILPFPSRLPVPSRLHLLHSGVPWLSQTDDCRMAVFLTPTVASAADASTQDDVSNSDTILRAGLVVSTRKASEGSCTRMVAKVCWLILLQLRQRLVHCHAVMTTTPCQRSRILQGRHFKAPTGWQQNAPCRQKPALL